MGWFGGCRLATGDVAAVDAAMDRFGALYLRARPGFATRSTQRSDVSSYSSIH
jgi:hypothetical protein